MTTTIFPDLAGAIKIEKGWDYVGPDRSGAPVVLRGFEGTTWGLDRLGQAADITVSVDGNQYQDGHSERYVVVSELRGYDDRLTPTEARQLAGLLIEAANEADRMAGYDQIEF